MCPRVLRGLTGKPLDKERSRICRKAFDYIRAQSYLADNRTRVLMRGDAFAVFDCVTEICIRLVLMSKDYFTGKPGTSLNQFFA